MKQQRLYIRIDDDSLPVAYDWPAGSFFTIRANHIVLIRPSLARVMIIFAGELMVAFE